MYIFIVDEHILFREGLVTLLNSLDEFTVVGDATSAREALDLLERRKPELILIGVDHRDEDELEAIKQLCNNDENTKVALLYNQEPDELLLDTISWGVIGFISKRTSITSVCNSIRAIKRGEAVIPRKFTLYLLEELVRLRGINRSLRDYSEGALKEIFTARELEVLTLLGTGATNQDIAHGLSISKNTVRVHVHNILDKLQLQNRRQAGGFAKKQGLTTEIKGKFNKRFLTG